MDYLGYRYNVDGIHSSAFHLESLEAVKEFIRENFEEPQIIITDLQDRQLLLMKAGVDLFCDLDHIGISLVTLLEDWRKDQIHPASSIENIKGEKPHWEVLYDQIGLSTGEIRMRQRVKTACRSVQTVQDVAMVIQGTYFDAHFRSHDGKKWYRFFDSDTFEASLMTLDASGDWVDAPGRRVLCPETKVRHLRSSEDVHTFVFVD